MDRRIKGRGTATNPANRFEPIAYEPDPEYGFDEDAIAQRTQFFDDASKSVITYNNSPDVGFDASVNPYRGCEHGCAYCFARPYHEYLGFSAGLDFETKIMVKRDAAHLLRAELSAKKWQPQTIALSGATDVYQPIEKRLQITRQCLEVLNEFRNPVVIITKNQLVARDADLLSDLARDDAAAVFVSVTTLDLGLNRKLEPRSSTPAQRLRAIEALAEAGVPVGVLVAPIIPGLTDEEVPRILEAAADAGAKYARYIVLRLPLAVAPIFEDWLHRHAPGHADKVLNRVRDMRGGALYKSEFGKRMRGEGFWADQIAQIVHVASAKHGLSEEPIPLSADAFKRPGGEQLALFQ